MSRLPAVPLVASDPYLSIWMPADTMTETDSIHWSGPVKAIRGTVCVDGNPYRFLGSGEMQCTTHETVCVTPTQTEITSKAGPVDLTIRFLTPAIPDDLDLLSMPVTLIELNAKSTDDQTHDLSLCLKISDQLCYDGSIKPAMQHGHFLLGAHPVAWCGQKVQKPLSHSGDRITMDWGYLYLSSNGMCSDLEDGLCATWSGIHELNARAVLSYDDIASINYFGDLCKPWYRRNGAQVTDAIQTAWTRFDAIKEQCHALDSSVLARALEVGGEKYQRIVSAAWRHTFAAHKLIATPHGEMALLSKENDSNGCIGTVDVSYPSIPIFLLFAPELVNALCRPVLTFAEAPVWTDDFAPHDVGRYPFATGQVYALKQRCKNGETYPPIYLYPEGTTLYDSRNQMPVEECGNMLIMLEAARAFGADDRLAISHRRLLDQWVQYLVQYGEDPGEQLCTDDFAGHLAHNVNLAIKAIVGIACYARLTKQGAFMDKAQKMAKTLMERIGQEGNTPLTLDGTGWSMKYNLLWDRVLQLNLFSEEFYQNEIVSYVKRVNRYGLPLDSRADYTKSDWICWVARLTDDMQIREALLNPIAKYLEETSSRVPFSDWYDTRTGRYVAFIARSVQGGLFAPMLPYVQA